MKLGLRLLLGFFLITGVAAYFVLRVFVQEVRPSVREVMEDMLVDTANLLAELVHDDLARLPPDGSATLAGTPFATAVQQYAARPIDAQIWGLAKTSLDYRVYVTDARGRVVFDAGGLRAGGAAAPPGGAVGQDYSRWRDVALTLDGRYGARATREVQADERSSVLYVAAPVRDQGRVIGVVTVAKPVITVVPFIERAQRKILGQGAWLLGLSLAIGIAVTGWLVVSVRRLRRYAQQVEYGERRPPPRLSGELGELALAIDGMRARVEGRGRMEQTVRALTHELKSPMAAIAGAAELLQDELPAADRQAFARQITEQVGRQQRLVERLLELSKLEQRQALGAAEFLDLGALVDETLDAAAARLRQRGLRLQWLRREPSSVKGEREPLLHAIGNLLDNAIDFAPAGSMLELSLGPDLGGAVWTVRDHGPGVPDYALPHLGERFYTTPRPAEGEGPGRRGTGLGLAIVREVAVLHGGRPVLEPAQPGLRAGLWLPGV